MSGWESREEDCLLLMKESALVSTKIPITFLILGSQIQYEAMQAYICPKNMSMLMCATEFLFEKILKKIRENCSVD